jgi:hypothetical protein
LAFSAGGEGNAEHDELVMEMNKIRYLPSRRVQCTPFKIAPMIDRPGHPTG